MNSYVRTIAMCVNIFVTTNIYCDKHNFVVTNVLSWQAYFCCDKHTFVMTILLLSPQPCVCCDKSMLVMTKVLSWQAYFCQFRWRCAECQILSLPVPLPVFSAFSPEQLALIGPPSPTCHYASPSPPSIPLPVLWTPQHVSALMHPPSPTSLPMVTWCLNSSSLNSATSTQNVCCDKTDTCSSSCQWWWRAMV